MIKVFYSMFFVASLLNIGILIARNHRKVSNYFVLLFGSLVIISLGYMESPVTIYLGACFSWFFLTMCFSELCHVPVRKSIQCVSALVCTVCFHLALFLGVSAPAFKILYYTVASISVAADFCIILKSRNCRRQVSYVTSTWLGVSLGIMVIVFIIARGFHLEMPLLPMTITVSQVVMLILLRRIRRNDVETVAGNFYPGDQVGYVMLREIKGRQMYVSSNSQARDWFPELNELGIDKKLDSNTKEGKNLLKKLRANMKDNCSESQKTVRTSDSKQLTIDVRKIPEKAGMTFIFCLRDETELLAKETELQKRDAYLQEKNEDLKVKNEELTSMGIEVLKKKKELQQKEKELKALKAQESRYQGKITEYQQMMEFMKHDIDDAFRKNDQLAADIIMGLGIFIENRDINTGGHVERTSEVMKIFVTYLVSQGVLADCDPKDIERMIKAAPLHDFGKIAISDTILNKPDELTAEDRKIINTHPEKGASMVAMILQNTNDDRFKEISHNMVLYHHEKWDGQGYPESLSKEHIPLEARIMALVDVFDALVSPRSYKEAFSYDESFKIIAKGSGSAFDPELTKYFLDCRDTLEDYYNGIQQRNVA